MVAFWTKWKLPLPRKDLTARKKVLFRHGNTGPHTSRIVRERLYKNPIHTSKWRLFPTLNHLTGRKFKTDEDVIAEIGQYFDDLRRMFAVMVHFPLNYSRMYISGKSVLRRNVSATPRCIWFEIREKFRSAFNLCSVVATKSVRNIYFISTIFSILHFRCSRF